MSAPINARAARKRTATVVQATLQDAFVSGVAQFEFQLAGERFVTHFRDWMETIDWSSTAKPSKGMPNPRNPKRIQPEARRNRLLGF